MSFRRIFAEQDAIARLHVQRDTFALVVKFAGAYGDHFPFLRLFLSRIGDDDSALYAFFFFEPPHQHTVVERGDVDSHLCDPSGDLLSEPGEGQ